MTKSRVEEAATAERIIKYGLDMNGESCSYGRLGDFYESAFMDALAWAKSELEKKKITPITYSEPGGNIVQVHMVKWSDIEEVMG